MNLAVRERILVIGNALARGRVYLLIETFSVNLTHPQASQRKYYWQLED